MKFKKSTFRKRKRTFSKKKKTFRVNRIPRPMKMPKDSFAHECRFIGTINATSNSATAALIDWGYA